jgi:hypothetical protein
MTHIVATPAATRLRGDGVIGVIGVIGKFLLFFIPYSDFLFFPLLDTIGNFTSDTDDSPHHD